MKQVRCGCKATTARLIPGLPVAIPTDSEVSVRKRSNGSYRRYMVEYKGHIYWVDADALVRV